MAGEIIHIEFKSANFARTSEFYGRLFAWQTEQNGSGSYMKLSGPGSPSGGWVRADLVQSPGPIAYLVVDDLEAKLDEIEAAGGRVLVRNLPFAGGGEVGLFADPDGNVLGLWHRKATNGSSDEAANPGDKTTAAPKSPPKPTAKPAAKKPPKKK